MGREYQQLNEPIYYMPERLGGFSAQVLQEIHLKESMSPRKPCPACLPLNHSGYRYYKTSDFMHKGHSSC